MSSHQRPRPQDGLGIWIIDGGPERPALPSVPPPDRVIGVDRGGRHAIELGLTVDVLIGDLDSIDCDTRSTIERSGATVAQHPSDKDASDLELAIEVAADLGASRIDVVSGGGGRLGHLLTGALLVGHPRRAALPLAVHIGETVIRGFGPGSTSRVVTPIGADVTLLAVGGPAHSTTAGLRWNLRPDMPLEPGTSRGLSNVAVAEALVIDMHPDSQGCLVAVIAPGEDAGS